MAEVEEPGKAELDTLTATLPNLPDYARLVFVEPETLNDSNPILKLIKMEPRGYVKAFNPPRDTTHWITKQVQVYGGTIEPRAASALAAVVGAVGRGAQAVQQGERVLVRGRRVEIAGRVNRFL